MEGNLRFKIDWAACSGKEIYHFCKHFIGQFMTADDSIKCRGAHSGMKGQVGGFQNPGVCLQRFLTFLPQPLPPLLLLPFSARSFIVLCSEKARQHLLRRLPCIWPSSPLVLRTLVVRAALLCTEGHRFNSCQGLRFFLCPMLVTLDHIISDLNDTRGKLKRQTQHEKFQVKSYKYFKDKEEEE